MKLNRRAIALSLVAGLAVAPHAAVAQDVSWPTDQVEIVVPASPGGVTDGAARLVARFLEEKTGVNAIVVNQKGGGGVVAMQTVADANADGSKLLMFHGMLHVANQLGRSPYTIADFTPLGTTSQSNDVYVAQAAAPYNTLPELFEYAKANPGQVRVATQLGGTTQVKGQALSTMADGNIKLIDAGPQGERIASMLGGHSDVTVVGVSAATEYAASGDFKVLAVLNEEPDPFQPDWPTTWSQGVEISFPLTMALYAPPDASDDAKGQMLAAIEAIQTSDEFIGELQRMKQIPYHRDEAGTKEFLQGESSFVEGLLAN